MDTETEDKFKEIIYEIRIVNSIAILNMILLTGIVFTVLGILWLR